MNIEDFINIILSQKRTWNDLLKRNIYDDLYNKIQKKELMKYIK